MPKKEISDGNLKLTAEQLELISTPTPKEFIKYRQGRGSKKFSYVEGGYVISQLNKIFTPTGWGFEITYREINAKEVVVCGKLTIGNLSKERTGNKEVRTNSTLGDNLKSAETDALKKCASMFGVCLDVYWEGAGVEDEDDVLKDVPVEQPSYDETLKQHEPQSEAQKRALVMNASIQKIKDETDKTMLGVYRTKIDGSTNYTASEKAILVGLIEDKLK